MKIKLFSKVIVLTVVMLFTVQVIKAQDITGLWEWTDKNLEGGFSLRIKKVNERYKGDFLVIYYYGRTYQGDAYVLSKNDSVATIQLKLDWDGYRIYRYKVRLKLINETTAIFTQLPPAHLDVPKRLILKRTLPGNKVKL